MRIVYVSGPTAILVNGSSLSPGGIVATVFTHEDSALTFNFPGEYTFQAQALFGPSATPQNFLVRVRPGVQVTLADITLDRIDVSLVPITASGQLVLTVVGPRNIELFNGFRSGGIHTFSFDPASLPRGQYMLVRADWTVNGQTGTGTRTVSFNVLGTNRHSQYNTPAEINCTGRLEDAFITNVVNAMCIFAATRLRGDFIDEVNENGSGRSIDFGDVKREFFCVRPAQNPPPRARLRSFRQEAIAPACAGQALTDLTLARRPDHPLLACGDQVFILGLGSGAGTIKTVTDECPGCTPQQLDNYTTSPVCTGILDLGRFVTIRLR